MPTRGEHDWRLLTDARLKYLETEARRLRNRVDHFYPRLVALERREAAMLRDVASVISHTLIAVALIAAAVTLTVTGNDATPAWAALGAYVAGAGVQRVTSGPSTRSSSTP